MSHGIAFPVEVGGFTFSEEGFSLKGCWHPYENIKSMRFQVIRASINLSTDETYAFGLRTADDAMVGISVSDAAFSFNKKKVAEKKKNLLAVANYINQITFQRRFQTYLEQLHKNGYLEYKTSAERILGQKASTVFIYGNGDVSLAGKTMNVKRAKAAGTLKFGTAYGLGYDRTMNRFEISISRRFSVAGSKAAARSSSTPGGTSR